MRSELPLMLYYAIMTLGVLIAGFSQVMLKRAALKTYDSFLGQYLNPLVVIAYLMFVVSTACSVFAYRMVPISLTPMWDAFGQVLVPVLAYLLLGERPNRKKLIGLATVIAGILIFAL